MPLTDAAVRNAKPQEKPYKLSDSGGLYLFVPVTGARLWRLDYQHNGKRKTLSLGRYPSLKLAAAREQRDEAKARLMAGADPAHERKLAKISGDLAAKCTFGAVSAEYLERMKDEGQSAATLAKKRWLLSDLAAEFSERPISGITSIEILTLLRRVEASGRRETAVRLRSTISAVYRLAVTTLRATADPTQVLKGATKPSATVSRAALTGERQLGALAASIDDYDGWATLRCALRLILLTAQRPGEIRGMTWAEVDLPNARWRIPAARMKMRRDHEVPLSRQALAVLDDVAMVTGRRQGLVFPAIRSVVRPLSENAMNAALRRMGYTKDEHTSHGFRSSFSTIMNSRNHDPELIEITLAHQDQSVRAIYNRDRKWDGRVALMQAWADLVDDLKQ